MAETGKDKTPGIEASWLKVLGEEFGKPYFKDLTAFIRSEIRAGKVIYPPGPEIFSAFNLCPFDQVKVVIIGQDPYHNPKQANGLCFSVRKGINIPPSLENIFKEIRSDLEIAMPAHGDLEPWAEQGILLLNAILTVEHGKAGSHKGKGWEEFTNKVISTISAEKTGVVFLLWGAFAQEKTALIDESRHFILSASHPSPYSVRNGFFGCKHFSKTNELLKSMGKKPVIWKLN